MKTTPLPYWFYVFFLLGGAGLAAQNTPATWQQKIDYQIDIRLDDQTHSVQGREKVRYFNQSPDTLKRLYFHLYWNAIQPESPLARVSKEWKRELDDLKKSEQGRMDIFYVQQNGIAIDFQAKNTLLEVVLSRPLAPNDYDVLDIAWQAQMPVFTATAGRKSPGGLSYVVGHWYPKICGYDVNGWHFNPKPLLSADDYCGYASYKVDITLPKKYMILATGLLQNAAVVGAGYQDSSTVMKPNYSSANTWKFAAEQVRDFAWIADPDLLHDKRNIRPGLEIHHFYPKKGQKNNLDALEKQLTQFERAFGPYPFSQWSFVQAAGPEFDFPMLAFAPFSERESAPVLLEKSSSWQIQMQEDVMHNILTNNDFLQQLRYVSGDDAYCEGWKKVRANHALGQIGKATFLRYFERAAGIELDWLPGQFFTGGSGLDYAVEAVKADGNGTQVQIKKMGDPVLPIEILVVTKNDVTSLHYIPLEAMLGHRKGLENQHFAICEAWPDGDETYTLHLNIPANTIRSVTLDPYGKTGDVNPKNNVMVK